MDMQNIPAAANASDSGPPAWFRKFILYGLFPYRKRLAITLMPARLMQRLGLDRLARSLGLTRLLPVHLQRMHDQLPVLQPAGPPLPNFLPAVGTRRATVALFLGCVADAMFRHVHWATARVLQQNGCDVLIPSNQSCCGAIHYHSGGSGPLLNLMLQNCESFADERIDAVIVNVAGCGSMLKDYSHIIDELHGSTESQNQQIRNLCSRIRDVHEFLADLGPVQPSGTLNLKVAYQDACHLQHAQRIRQQPRDLLNLIPGLKLTRVDEPELCCGAAGTYNLTQPEMADRLGKRKTDHLLAESPDLIASANAGCSLQLQAQLRRAGKNIPVLHPVEILDLSYRNIQPRES